MSRMNRRRFTWVATSGIASAALVACSGDAVDEDLTPTRIANVEGAPPTLAPNATPFSADDAGEEGGESGGGEGGGAVEAVTIEAHDPFNWSTNELQAAPGQEIRVINAGSLQHDFVIDEWEIATDLLNSGDEATVTVPEDAEVGTEVTYYCSVPGHRESGMEGTLTVVEAAAGGEEEAPAEEDDAAAAGGGEAVVLEAHDPFNWSTNELEAAPGQEIRVVNAGSLQHDFVIDEWEISTDLLNGGDEATVTVPEDAEVGTQVTYYCSVPGHRESGMEGTLTVVEGGGGEAAAEEPAEEEGGEEEAVAAGPVDPSETIVVEALDSLAYEPSEITAAPGQVILVRNVGSLQHDFVVDEWGLATSLLNGGTEEEFIVPQNAEVGQSFTFYCSVPGHQAAGMQGTLTIAEASGEAAATEEEEEATEEPATPEETASTLEIDDNAIRVAALDSMRFAPAQFSAAPGQQIHLVNTGVLIHDIVIDEWGIDSGALGGGEETTFNIPDDAEIGAEIPFYCSVPGHLESGMEGSITIVEADSREAGLATPASEATPAEAASPVDGGDTGGAEASPAAAATEDAASGGGATAVSVKTVDIAFEPKELSIPADTDVEITVTNAGVLQHDFIIEDTDFGTELLDGGSEATITVNLAAGEYTYFCSVPGHREAGMEGTLTVE